MKGDLTLGTLNQAAVVGLTVTSTPTFGARIYSNGAAGYQSRAFK